MGGYAYVAPGSIDEAVAVLTEHAGQGKRAQILAGGTDLLVQMQSLDNSPRTIVDIKQIAETNAVDIGASETYIGAAIPSAVLNENSDLKAMFPGLLESADLIGSTQIQGRASIGGNLCNSSPAGDTIPAMIVNAGICVIAGSAGTRELVVNDFVTGVGTNRLEDGEILIGLKFPNPAPRTADAYLRFIPRTEMDIAVAGAGVCLTLDESGTCTAARVAIGAVATTVLLVEAAAAALVGTKVDDPALEAAAAACSEAAAPITDKRGTVKFRRKVVGVLCKRAAAIARDRASR
ncbi:MAG: FAD binding domain-containing protein [Pseudomonadales bacterium]